MTASHTGDKGIWLAGPGYEFGLGYAVVTGLGPSSAGSLKPEKLFRAARGPSTRTLDRCSGQRHDYSGAASDAEMISSSLRA